MNGKSRFAASRIFIASVTCLVFMLGFRARASGRIVAAFDDWTLADIGFRPGDQPAIFATNVAAWFTGNHPGRLLAYSTHPGYTGVLLSNAMVLAGHTWLATTNTSFTVTNLLNYDAVFVGGDVVDTNVLIQYVEAGGNVYVFSGGITANAQWNGFVGYFGLQFACCTSGSFDYPITSSHPILNGVSQLYALNGADNGSTVVDLDPSDAKNAVVGTYQSIGLFAVWDGGPPEAPLLGIRISAVQGNRASETELSWTSHTNRNYQVEYCSSLSPNAWTNLGAIVPGQNIRTFITVIPDQAERFYRVVLLP